MRHVTIAGAGLIGRGWAAAFARSGWVVTLWDAVPEVLPRAEAAVRTTLADMAAAGLVVTMGEIRCQPDLAQALEQADYVQENVPEDRVAKADLFALLDRHAPSDARIGSSTSTFPGTWFLSEVPGRHRCMVAHPANPPHLMPVVELVPSPWHAAADTTAFVDILESIGQVPVVLKREIEGFVMNRMQTAVVNEAVALVAQGVIDPEGLDKVMKHSLGLRWSLMGPFETMDLNAPNGFQDYATRYASVYQSMGRQLSVADDWTPEAVAEIEAARRAAVPQAQVGERMEWRNRALMQLMVLKEGLKTP